MFWEGIFLFIPFHGLIVIVWHVRSHLPKGGYGSGIERLTMQLPDELIRDLRKNIAGDVRTDLTTRILYSTDASIYRMEPLGVVFPLSIEDLYASVELAGRYGVPVLARGSGSSLAGQAIGAALILDCSRYLDKIIAIDPQNRTATVEPGVILERLNREAGKYGLMFGPDPASAERATMGGSIANNATGAHSILYGMAADHLLAADVIFADASRASLQALSMEEARNRARDPESSVENALYHLALHIRQQHAEAIYQNWPRVWRRASGYNLNYLLPWSPSRPPRWDGSGSGYPPLAADEINLAPLLAGSEGTLGVISRLRLRLVPKPSHSLLGVLTYESISAACDAAPELLAQPVSAIELIPGTLIRLARSVPAYASQANFVQGEPAAMLVVEFSGDDPRQLQSHMQHLQKRAAGEVLVAEAPVLQKQIWSVRKVGLGLLMSMPGDRKPLSFIEDISVPVEKLGSYVRSLEHILEASGTTAEFYAHASAGCLHIRPLLSLKNDDGVRNLRRIAEEAVALGLSLGGATSGEHGEGLARSEWEARQFGPQIMDLFRQVKAAVDPHGLFNPGKILDALPMDQNLRYGAAYQSRIWPTEMDFTRQAGLDGAIEMCNGAGVCRKDGGVMCPSFQATREEMHSTRGRANLLRAMISGAFPTQQIAEKAVAQALDLCLACKGCKAECPSAVDVAKLKYEFTDRYYQGHRRRLRDYLFAYIDRLAPAGRLLAPLVNRFLDAGIVRLSGERWFGLANERRFPRFAGIRKAHLHLGKGINGNGNKTKSVLFLTDAFSHYFHPQTELAGVRVLERCGEQVSVLPMIGAGRTLISKGFLGAARRHASQLLAVIRQMDPQGQLPVVGIEPSEIYTLRDEFLDLFPGDAYMAGLSQRAWMVDEYLVRPAADGRPRVAKLADGPEVPAESRQVWLHGHCYQKAQPPSGDGFPIGVAATTAMLRQRGYAVQVIDSGCCGMAGAFGYEAEHYSVSMQVAELALFPALRQAPPGVIIAAAGTSCRSQIQDGTSRESVHPICLL
jgi:FAD/FMN-containing dehydrogenase/Fe-S oxidoreductase